MLMRRHKLSVYTVGSVNTRAFGSNPTVHNYIRHAICV